MAFALVAEKLFDGERILEDVSLIIDDDGRIASVGKSPQSSATYLQGLLAPGLVDVQVNGGGGVLFNQEPNVAGLRTMGEAHARFGTTAFLPTLITDRLDIMQEAANAVSAALHQQVSGVIGIHFEGPHLSVPKKGTHEQSFIRPLGDEEWQIYAREDLGIKVVTLAPETVPMEDISRLSSMGVRVCLGHSNADGETVRSALQAGAVGFTHLYNAMSPLHSREPGMVGSALVSDEAWCGIIADGHHVSAEAITLALKVKPHGKLLLVTDAMSLVGSDALSFPLFDRVVTREGDKLTSSTGELAGSHLDMMGAVRNISDWCGLDICESLRMASLYPCQFLGSQGGRIVPGTKANFILLDRNFNVQKTWIGGRQVYGE
ncbi:N-acetylglucosamine-6-phosphate deacetylase [Microbulbifer sp. DLAB2-AA]|uniref:N-acetylglucosamine-6-phosphate deacetylase n=1 Tax=Microbulbifer sp. DLAB2-AA TaxID=3243394 RepID=UPI00403976C4